MNTAPPSSARLFEGSKPGPPSDVCIANIDGASRGNPGPAAYAVILRTADGTKLFEAGKMIGRETNNVAEYYGLVAALDYAVSHGIRALRIRSDSELLVRQMQGRYKVKSAELKPLHERARKMALSLDYFVIEHVLREQNADADALANLALDRGGNLSRAGGTSEQRSAASRNAKTFTIHVIRATYKGGVFTPDEPINLPEGSTVDLQYRISK